MASSIATTSRVMLPTAAAAAQGTASAACTSVRRGGAAHFVRRIHALPSRAQHAGSATTASPQRQDSARLSLMLYRYGGSSVRHITSSSSSRVAKDGKGYADAAPGTTLQQDQPEPGTDLPESEADTAAGLKRTSEQGVSTVPNSGGATLTASSAASKDTRMAALETDILDVQEEVDTERELRRLRRTMVDQFQSLGSTQNRETTFRPHHARMSPKAARDLTISHLLASNAHVGHHKSQTTRAFQPLLLGTRNNMSIIDIEKHTLPALKRCAQVVRKVLSADGVILFVGTGKNQTASILRACKRLGRNAFHVTMERWIPGTLTNAPKLLAPAIYKSFEDADADLSGAPDTTKLASQTFQPDLVVVLNPRENVHAVREATDRNIPTIGIIDTNVDPRLVTYAIPGNDDSLRFVDLVVGVIARAGQEGIAEGARLRDEADKARRSDERGRRRLLQA